MNAFLIVIGLLVVVGAIILVIVGIRQNDEEDPLEARLAEFASLNEQTSLEEIELSQPFAQRVILPLAKKFGEVAIRFTPQKAIQETTQKLEQAGNPRGLDPTIFLAIRVFAGLGLGFMLFMLLNVFAKADIKPMLKFLAPLIGLIFGFYVPDLLLTSKIKRRQDDVKKALPDALDLLTICVEAGLGFDASMKKVNEKWDNELSLAFGRALQEIQLGKTRREALRSMSDRLGVSEMDSFVAAIIQSEQLGVSMAKVLRIQSDDMRVRRRQAIEEKAQQLPIQMLFPMALLIFPTIFIMLLGPAALQMFSSGVFSSLGGGGF